MRKRMMVTMMAAAISASFAFAAFAGEWGQDEKGSWYKNDSGSYAREQMVEIDGATYGFNQEAYMVNGWGQFNGVWYYFEPGAGNQVSGWKQLGDNWYYLNPAAGNAMQTSWLRQGTKLYYFNGDGTMQTANSRFYVNSFAYETDETGAVKRNTTEDKGDGRIFIFEDDGKMKYKNDTLLLGNKVAGSDVYVYLMEGELNEQTKSDTMQAISDAIVEKEDELYEEYKEKVLSETKSSRRQRKRTEWEEKVRRILSALSASNEEIEDYIYLVEKGQYDLDDYDYYYD